ncbi:amidohydrolase [Exophiala viscosa]|uniref:Amidohydrolase n=1 Tax=Exophiala viscosa TaxID=2486360 RepID=A0AAN6IG71_9EURO|nr:amidohydrolase [Exophiala viscosa]
MATTVITNVRLFDGENVQSVTNVVISGTTISGIGSHVQIPEGATIIYGEGCTLLPGLIDSHVHTGLEQLELALKFGVTTELEMMGHWELDQRREISKRDDIADLKTASFGLTRPNGHPYQLTKAHDAPQPDAEHPHATDEKQTLRHAETKEQAIEFVRQRVAEEADYIKIMIEEGSVFQTPGLPLLSDEAMVAAVQEAHRHNKVTVAHALTYSAAEKAIAIGIDGLTHLFIDRGTDNSFLDKMQGKFVTPCLTLDASLLGLKPTAFAADPRVAARLPPVWYNHLQGSMDKYTQGDLDVVLKSVAALHKAGIDILVGTDSSFPIPNLAGIAHGASVHHELQLLVQAGLTPLEALRAATSVPARRFGLFDRGRVHEGLRADLLLVDGDPTRDIKCTLSIKSVWRRGCLLDIAK